MGLRFRTLLPLLPLPLRSRYVIPLLHPSSPFSPTSRNWRICENFVLSMLICLQFGVLDLARRSALCLRAALVALHLIYVGVLFLFDGDLIDKTRRQPWYGIIDLVNFVSYVLL